MPIPFREKRGLWVPSVLLVSIVASWLLLHSWSLSPGTQLHPAIGSASNSVKFSLLRSSKYFQLVNSPSSLDSSDPNTVNTLLSPNGIFKLQLEALGALRLSQRAPDGQWRSLFWSNTGDGYQGRSHGLQLDNNGLLSLYYKEKNSPDWIKMWHSELLRHCTTAAELDEHSALLLTDDGNLEIHSGKHGDGQLLCSLHHPIEETALPRGRLGLLVSGLYRNNHQVCKSHIEKVVKKWPGSGVDIFVYTYHEKEWQKSQIEAKIRQCYGEHAKAIVVEDLHAVSEVLSDEDYPPQCAGGKANRLLSQLKTMYRNVQMLYSYMLKTGVDYDYLLRIRTDTYLKGDIPWEAVNEEKGSRLILPHPNRGQGKEHYFWCALPSGSISIGPSDQLAFGRKHLMLHWLEMYVNFVQLLSEGRDDRAFRSYLVGEAMPSRALPWESEKTGYCSIECHIAYYLSMRGVPFEVTWHWEQASDGGLMPEGLTKTDWLAELDAPADMDRVDQPMDLHDQEDVKDQHKVMDLGDIQDMDNIEDLDDVEDSEDVDSLGNVEDLEDPEDSEDVEALGDAGDVKDVKSLTKSTGSSDAKGSKDDKGSKDVEGLQQPAKH